MWVFGVIAQLGAHHTGSVGVRGSSPLCSTTKKRVFCLLDKRLFFRTKCSALRNVKYPLEVKRTSCVKCAFGTIRGTLNFTLCEAQYFTAALPLLHLAQPNFTKFAIRIFFYVYEHICCRKRFHEPNHTLPHRGTIRLFCLLYFFLPYQIPPT